MRIFNPIHRGYVSPIEIQTLDKGLATLEQGHKEAVKAASDLQVSIANLPMHESESQYKQAKLAEIKDKIANGTVYGNSAGSLDDIIALTGELGSDQGILGRIESNKKFQEQQKAIDARQDITELDKEYFKSLNPYSHKDIVDPKTGKIIGYESFKPTRNPVSTMDWNKHFRNAMAYAAKEAGGGDNTMWMDASGRMSSVPTENATYYNKRSGKWERLSKEKLNAALMASIKGDPEAMLSIQQDYEVSLWDHKRKTENGQISARTKDVISPRGTALSLDEYIKNKVDPFTFAASYYNSFSTSDWTQVASGRGRGTGRGSGGGSGDGEQTLNYPINATVVGGMNVLPNGVTKGDRVDIGKQAFAGMKTNFANRQNNLNAELSKYGIKPVSGLTVYSTSSIMDSLKRSGYLDGTNGKTKISRNELDKLTTVIGDYNSAHHVLRTNADPRALESFVAASFLANGDYEGGGNNRIMQSYRKSLDQTFGDSNIFVKTDNFTKQQINDFKKAYKTVYGKDYVNNLREDIKFTNDKNGKRLYTMFIDKLSDADESFDVSKFTMYRSKDARTDYDDIAALRPGVGNSTARMFNVDGSKDFMKNVGQTIKSVKRAKAPSATDFRNLEGRSREVGITTHGSTINQEYNNTLANEGHLKISEAKAKSDIEDEMTVNALKSLSADSMEGIVALNSEGKAVPITDKKGMVSIIKTLADNKELASHKFSEIRDANGEYHIYFTLDYNDFVYKKKSEDGNSLVAVKVPKGKIMIPMGEGKPINSEAATRRLQILNGSQGVREISSVPGTSYIAGIVNGQAVSVTSKVKNGTMEYFIGDKPMSPDAAIELKKLIEQRNEYIKYVDQNPTLQTGIDAINNQIDTYLNSMFNNQ